MRTDGWTEYRQSYRHGEVNSLFSQFCERSQRLKHMLQEQDQARLQAQQCSTCIVGPEDA